MKTYVVIALLLQSLALCAQPLHMDSLGRYEFGEELSNLWGYADEEGNEYALVGRFSGFSVLDVTDPTDITEVFSTPGATSIWREVKTWNHHTYITCESPPGLLIVDLSPLPQSTNLPYTYWLADTLTFYTAHSLYIDENGIAYIYGPDYGMRGAVMLDLNTDPMNPAELGAYDTMYVHDGFVRGDTLWAAAINNGEVQVVDVSDKANPVLLSSWKTPYAFTHNTWMSDDRNVLFTTDELKNAYIAAYDVSDIYNTKHLDSWRTNDTAIIPHNTHFHNGFLVNSHYTIGVVVLDASRPHNLIETGHYDTSPDYTYEGFHGCWGVYPYLPSGNILSSDIEEGLYVLGCDYVRGCYLEGRVTDEHTGWPIYYPSIEILELSMVEEGSIIGRYAMGTHQSGTYTVRVSADGYFPDTISGVQLINGQLTELDVQLSNWPAHVEEQEGKNDIELFPNPTDGSVTLLGVQAGTLVQCHDSRGLLVYEQRTSTDDEQLSLNLSPGFYTVSLELQSGLAVKRLMVR